MTNNKLVLMYIDYSEGLSCKRSDVLERWGFMCTFLFDEWLSLVKLGRHKVSI